ncbi:MAG: SDR family oxidoreductase [Planctomycetales bacterium]|nr:SDR family oxidoreductase [Planctomycetales bacterium]
MTADKLPGIRLFDLTNQAAIVTGGSKGLGFAIASGLASAGCRVMLVSRHLAEAESAANLIREQFSVDTFGHEADVTCLDACQKMVAAAVDRWTQVQILVNSAGINIRGPIDELSAEQFDQVMNINVRGTWNACRSIVPAMKGAGYGRIVNLASTLGLVGLANRTPYASSKGAVVQMTRALGLELAPFGITCNAICPGPFLTEMNIPIADSEEAKKFIVGAVALNRWGELAEIQGSAIYLASPAASYTTGSMLTVDGGWTAR